MSVDKLTKVAVLAIEILLELEDNPVTALHNIYESDEAPEGAKEMIDEKVREILLVHIPAFMQARRESEDESDSASK